MNPAVIMLGEEASEDKLGGIAGAFAKAKEFLEVTGFNFGVRQVPWRIAWPGKPH